MNTLYLRRRSKVLLPQGTGTESTPLNVVATLQKNIETLGFLLADDVAAALKTLDPAQVNAFYERLAKDLRTLVGAHRTFEPMYPGFPAQVMTMSEAKLYWNAIAHYRMLDRL